jgi:hypothetical protein
MRKIDANRRAAFAANMTKPRKSTSWWRKPAAIVAYVCALIAGIVTLKTNLDTIMGWLGFGLKPATITLQVFPAKPEGKYLVAVVNVTKTGQGVLHDCNFSAWIQGFQMSTSSAMATFSIPEGQFFQTTQVYIELPPLFARVRNYGEIYLQCDKASSESVRFDITRSASESK